MSMSIFFSLQTFKLGAFYEIYWNTVIQKRNCDENNASENLNEK